MDAAGLFRAVLSGRGSPKHDCPETEGACCPAVIKSAQPRSRSKTGVPVSVPVTRAEGSSLSQRYRIPPTAPPTIGATQNSQSCASAHPPAKRAGPVLRAGLTEQFVTGMPTN